ncbi:MULTISPECIES: ATP-dependent zinc metalloprotease FtsH [Eubacterium]|uniref:ATP-dependent zinc metalloprotease FtsH n=1 Tax=Eubacterium uniforme TaxID=39495 RepID=A0A1T4VCV4_9FIRM|nr:MULTISPECIES: ATP-dependent zinc metalloprotease FtsH [Eubacterium]MCR5629754.1 ATP-dependent zinc metalloprotease FtsH [Eubacterium sp.]SKA62391.1 cell division protease FtsH [Eubacterium uniforme]HAV91237.1 ATP-dependent metallopeptidase FtsH/Yme1/Tma family protein [Eubacterium sp.]
MKKGVKEIFFYLTVVAIIVGIVYYVTVNSNVSQDYTYESFVEDLKEGQIENVAIKQNKEIPTGKLTITYKNDDVKSLFVPDVNKVVDDLAKAKDTKYVVKDVSRDSIFLTDILPLIIILATGIFFFFMINGSMGGGANSKMANFGRSRARLVNDTKNINFEKVAGLEEEKEELAEIVDFLKDPKKYIEIGARIPKGVILTGPPGTGKTLLGKAVAGEAGVPFYIISGSDFVEMFVGVGASRVRDLFAEAKKNSPAIVFIDEIDAVARRRGTGMGGGHDEREQTLNQLLVEMDGFSANEGIIVMAATNRIDILDPAILRPGRFDRKVTVGRPDVKGREAILNVHAKNKPLGDDVKLDEVARITAGFTGADLENLLNEAAILAAKDKRKYIIQKDINKAMIKVGIGTERKSRIISDEEKKITAYHEMGHAILFHLLPNVGPVHTVSIIPTGMGAAGYTMPLPAKDEMFLTRGKMIDEIMVDLGGRIAEELVLDDITTGASQDIKQATATAKAMVTKYGMSEKLGLINYNDDSDDVFIGRDLAHSKAYGENTATAIDEEVRGIVSKCYNDAKNIITENIDVLHKGAQLLLEKEKINQEEFEALFA